MTVAAFRTGDLVNAVRSCLGPGASIGTDATAYSVTWAHKLRGPVLALPDKLADYPLAVIHAPPCDTERLCVKQERVSQHIIVDLVFRGLEMAAGNPFSAQLVEVAGAVGEMAQQNVMACGQRLGTAWVESVDTGSGGVVDSFATRYADDTGLVMYSFEFTAHYWKAVP